MIAGARRRTPPGAIALGLVCAFGLLALGCGSTRIMANDKNATIFVNGVQVGTGQAKIPRRGGPAAMEVRAETPDGREARTVIKRRFAPIYAIIILWGWAYPGEVNLELPPPPERYGWDAEQDPWARPPAGWRPASEDPADRPSSPPDWNSPENTQSSSQDEKPPARPPAPKPERKPEKPASGSDGGSAWDRPPPSTR